MLKKLSKLVVAFVVISGSFAVLHAQSRQVARVVEKYVIKECWRRGIPADSGKISNLVKEAIQSQGLPKTTRGLALWVVTEYQKSLDATLKQKIEEQLSPSSQSLNPTNFTSPLPSLHTPSATPSAALHVAPGNARTQKFPERFFPMDEQKLMGDLQRILAVWKYADPVIALQDSALPQQTEDIFTRVVALQDPQAQEQMLLDMIVGTERLNNMEPSDQNVVREVIARWLRDLQVALDRFQGVPR